MNLTKLYKGNTFPASSIYAGMILIIKNCEDHELIDGTKVKVKSVGKNCTSWECDEYKQEICCRREISIETVEEINNRKRYLVGCYCTLYTLYDKEVVFDDKYVQKLIV